MIGANSKQRKAFFVPKSERIREPLGPCETCILLIKVFMSCFPCPWMERSLGSEYAVSTTTFSNPRKTKTSEYHGEQMRIKVDGKKANENSVVMTFKHPNRPKLVMILRNSQQLHHPPPRACHFWATFVSRSRTSSLSKFCWHLYSALPDSYPREQQEQHDEKEPQDHSLHPGLQSQDPSSRF